MAIASRLVWLVGLLPVACSVAPAPAARGRFEVVVLGTAQDGGLPHFGCNRQCCASARASGRELFPASLGVIDHDTGKLLLIEATPRVEPQVALLHALAGAQDRGRRPVDAVLLTHAHIGHYLGLAHFGREVASTPQLPVHVSPRMAAFLRGHGPWTQLVAQRQIELHEFAPGSPFSPIDGLTVTAIPVPHRDEWSDTMAFVLQGPRQQVLFVPDVDAWDQAPGLLDRLLDGVDVAFLDGTFWDGRELPDRNRAEIPHPLMVDTIGRLRERAQRRPGSLRFLHLNHTNPALHDPAIGREVTAAGFAIAQQGERVPL
ncbi:MAG: MBL fold metallo-hydrolase [Planctomycetes bacterium]|nr:MBL fold metallo-hydrolase [Planctomycetota bacterium]